MAALPAGCWESSPRGGEGVVFRVLVLQHPLMVPPGWEEGCACTPRFSRGFETCLRWVVVFPV